MATNKSGMFDMYKDMSHSNLKEGKEEKDSNFKTNGMSAFNFMGEIPSYGEPIG